MSPQLLTKNVTETLVRGNHVRVGSDYEPAGLRGKKLIIASKGPVPCNKKGRCAGDHCIGKAVFVTDPTKAQPVNNNDGKRAPSWRTGTAKICLTHLYDDSGSPIVATGTRKARAVNKSPKDASAGPEVPSTPKRRGRPPGRPKTKAVAPEPVAEPYAPIRKHGVTPATMPPSRSNIVTWDELAHAATSNSVEALSLIGRRLKQENENLVRRLIDAQAKVIAALEMR